jgi:hypothetical protein
MRERRSRFGDRERSRAVCGATGPMARSERAVRLAGRRHAGRRHADRRHADRRHADRRHANRCRADRRHAERCRAHRRFAERRHADHRISEYRHALLRNPSPRNSASCTAHTGPTNRLTPVSTAIEQR